MKAIRLIVSQDIRYYGVDNLNVLNAVQLQTIATGLWILSMFSFAVATKWILVHTEWKKQ